MINVKKAMSFFMSKLVNETKRTSSKLRPEQSQKENKEHAGWISPVYNQSRRIHLNPIALAENRCLAFPENNPETEAYRMLRTQVMQRTHLSRGNIIMVTSALSGEGKTLTAINFAFSLAREFQHTVLLVDADLRNQRIKKYLGCDSEKGLIDCLAGNGILSDIIMWPGIEKIAIITGGHPHHESAEILGSPRMKELTAEMKHRYPERFIIFDAPPVLTGADTLTLSSTVDHIIVVVKAGETQMDVVNKALQYLPQEKILGFVLNGCDSAESG